MVSLLRRLGFVPVSEISISDERVNATVQAERRREYEGDVEYRDRVKRRMLLGEACADPPLIDAGKWRRRARALRVVGK